MCVTAGMLCSGCWPRSFTTSPGVSGIVLDAQTRSPVAGAKAAVSLSKYPPGSLDEAVTRTRTPQVTTDDAGQFSIPKEQRWGIYIWPVDSYPEFGLLVVRRDGYETSCIPIWSHSVTNLGPVLLKPKS
jgi:hypothetical protein